MLTCSNLPRSGWEVAGLPLYGRQDQLRGEADHHGGEGRATQGGGHRPRGAVVRGRPGGGEQGGRRPQVVGEAENGVEGHNDRQPAGTGGQQFPYHDDLGEEAGQARRQSGQADQRQAQDAGHPGRAARGAGVVGQPAAVAPPAQRDDRGERAQLQQDIEEGVREGRRRAAGGRLAGARGGGGDRWGGRGGRARGGREPAEVQRAGRRVEQRRPEQRDRRRHDAHHEERDRRVDRPAAEGDQDVQRQGERLQRDDQRDEVTRVPEHHAAGHRAAEQEVVLAEALARHGQQDNGQGQPGEERGQEGGAGVGDVRAVGARAGGEQSRALTAEDGGHAGGERADGGRAHDDDTPRRDQIRQERGDGRGGREVGRE